MAVAPANQEHRGDRLPRAAIGRSPGDGNPNQVMNEVRVPAPVGEAFAGCWAYNEKYLLVYSLHDGQTKRDGTLRLKWRVASEKQCGRPQGKHEGEYSKAPTYCYTKDDFFYMLERKIPAASIAAGAPKMPMPAFVESDTSAALPGLRQLALPMRTPANSSRRAPSHSTVSGVSHAGSLGTTQSFGTFGGSDESYVFPQEVAVYERSSTHIIMNRPTNQPERYSLTPIAGSPSTNNAGVFDGCDLYHGNDWEMGQRAQPLNVEAAEQPQGVAILARRNEISVVSHTNSPTSIRMPFEYSTQYNFVEQAQRPLSTAPGNQHPYNAINTARSTDLLALGGDAVASVVPQAEMYGAGAATSSTLNPQAEKSNVIN